MAYQKIHGTTDTGIDFSAQLTEDQTRYRIEADLIGEDHEWFKVGSISVIREAIRVSVHEEASRLIHSYVMSHTDMFETFAL